MESFKTFFKEASGFPTGPVGENPNNLAGSIEINPAALGNPNVVKRLNAVIGAIANMTTFSEVILSYIILLWRTPCTNWF